MAPPFVNIAISLVIEKESNVKMENLEFIAEGGKDYVTFLLNMLQFSGLWLFSLNSARILSFTSPFCDANFVVFICLLASLLQLSSLWGLKKKKKYFLFWDIIYSFIKKFINYH